MRRMNTRPKIIALAAALASAAGCGAPPSVAPLLRVTDTALRAEAQHIDSDIARLRISADQSRAALDHGFALDLEHVESLDKLWVIEAAQGYAAAREQLALHEARAAQVYADRRDNLMAAAEAQRRALALLEQQDRLIHDVIGVDLWRSMPWTDPRTPLPETPR